MAKRQSELSVRELQVEKKEKRISTKKIDFSDIPDSSDAELKRAKRIGRPSTGKAKQLIAFRISPLLLSKLKKIAQKKGKPYQTFIHESLEAFIKKIA
jgi:predicted DNA binding CopG/RHH family protein